MNTISALLRSGAVAAALLSVGNLPAQATLKVAALAPGYTVQSIELGDMFGGAMARHPHEEILYVSTGFYSANSVMEIRLDDLTTRTVTPPIGAIGGLAVLESGDLVITDNYDSTYDTILRCRDLNGDGAWMDAGEIEELIEPILVNNTFTGSYMAVAPAGNAAGIPAGALLVQTADGLANSEILVIDAPESGSPEYYPPGEAWYSGFMYDGGISFTPEGHVLAGISEFPVGRVTALVNSNSNDRIDAGESHDILGSDDLPNGIAGLGAADGKVLVTENSGDVRMFDLPGDLLTGTASNEEYLVRTNGSYLNLMVDFHDRDFGTGSTGPHATAYVSGYVGFASATNLLAITVLSGPSSAAGWSLYD